MADVCGDVLREWRQMEGEIALVDLKSAYLQVRVAKELWQYQLVRYQGETYCLMLRPCPGPTGRCTPVIGRREEGLPRRVQDAG